MYALPAIESQRVDLCPAGRPVRLRRRSRGDAQKNDVESRSRNKTTDAARQSRNSHGQPRTAPQPQNQAVPDHRSHEAIALVHGPFPGSGKLSVVMWFGTVASHEDPCSRCRDALLTAIVTARRAPPLYLYQCEPVTFFASSGNSGCNPQW